jgi:hypothetical protein
LDADNSGAEEGYRHAPGHAGAIAEYQVQTSRPDCLEYPEHRSATGQNSLKNSVKNPEPSLLVVS